MYGEGGNGGPGAEDLSRRDRSSGDRSGSVAGVRGGRVPPNNSEAERSVLGAVLVHNEAIHRVLEVGLEPRDFYRESHQKIFEVLISLSERGEPVDLVTLTAALRDRGTYESVGGSATRTLQRQPLAWKECGSPCR